MRPRQVRALLVAICLLAPQSDAAGQAAPAKYSSETVNISSRQSYFVDVDFTMDVPAGWSVATPTVVPASPAAQHGLYELTLTAPAAAGEVADLIVVRIRAHDLGMALADEAGKLPVAEADFLQRFASTEIVASGRFASKLMSLPVIMSKPGHRNLRSHIVRSTVADVVAPDGTPWRVRLYAVGVLNVTATVALIARPDSFAARTPEMAIAAGTFWAQIAHPYTE